MKCKGNQFGFTHLIGQTYMYTSVENTCTPNLYNREALLIVLY